MTQMLPEGTISHGTLITEDLFKSLYDAFVEVAEPDDPTLIWMTQALSFRAVMDDIENFWECCDEIEEKYVPVNHYLGMHQGDGSDFGVWQTDEHDEY